MKKIANLEKSYYSNTYIVFYPNWQVADAVRTSTISTTFKSYDISSYSYDISNLILFSKNGNYPALAYYSVNTHMYVVRREKKVESLIEKAKDIGIQIKTDMIE